MIRIGVDGRIFQGNVTGVGKYILNLLLAVKENNPSVTFLIFSNREIKVRGSGLQVVYDKPFYSRLKPMVWSKLFSHNLINKNRVDAFFSGDGFIPQFLNTKKIVSVVHDLNHILVPETMSGLHLVTAKLFFKNDLHKAKFIITNSKGTANKLEKYFHVKTDMVMFPLLDTRYEPLDQNEVKLRLRNLSIDYPYILSVATQEPRKNLSKTIEAFISLKKEGKLPEHKLLLVGSKGWKSDQIQTLTKGNKDIRSMGYISDEAMPYLYNGADLFVFPSKYEGFGMPPREALLCGTNVVVTDIEELREATSGYGLYIDPSNITEFKEAILKGLTLPDSNKFINNTYSSDQLDTLNTWINDSTPGAKI